METGVGKKVYSPDVSNYELDGETTVFKTASSLLVGPVRIVSRVMHNIMILPANLLASYAQGLLMVSAVMFLLGVVDYIVFQKWPLLISQVPAMLLALHLSKKAKRAIEVAQDKREVDINDAEVVEMCNGIYDELDAVIGEKFSDEIAEEEEED